MTEVLLATELLIFWRSGLKHHQQQEQQKYLSDRLKYSIRYPGLYWLLIWLSAA